MNNLPQDLVQIKQILGLKQQNLKGEQLKDLLLKRVKRLENMTVRSQYGSGILDELINVIELKTFKQGEFLYHYKDQCDHVYILLDGEVLVWVNIIKFQFLFYYIHLLYIYWVLLKI